MRVLFRVKYGPMPLHGIGWAHTGSVVEIEESILTPYYVRRYGEVLGPAPQSRAPASGNAPGLTPPDSRSLDPAGNDPADADPTASVAMKLYQVLGDVRSRVAPKNRMAGGGQEKSSE